MLSWTASPILMLAGYISLGLLSVAVIAAVYRIVRGPSILDRAIATDVLLISISSGLVVHMALRETTDLIMFVVVASVIGFLGSVTLSRFTVDVAPPRQDTGLNGPGYSDPVRAEDDPDVIAGHSEYPPAEFKEMRQTIEVKEDNRD